MRFEASYGFHAVIAILFLCFLHLAGQFFVLPLRIRSVHRRRAQRVISKVIIMDKRSVYEFVCVYVGCFMYLTLQRGGSWARNQAEAPFSFSPIPLVDCVEVEQMSNLSRSCLLFHLDQAGGGFVTLG